MRLACTKMQEETEQQGALGPEKAPCDLEKALVKSSSSRMAPARPGTPGRLHLVEGSSRDLPQSVQVPHLSAGPQSIYAQAVHADDEPPDGILCPITGEIMQDPVICCDGHSYERTSIQAWLAGHSTSPLTGAELEHKTLVPNFALHKVAEEWMVQHDK